MNRDDRPLPPHMQRVLEEKLSLDDKITKLKDFIEKNPFYMKLSAFEQQLLQVQFQCMTVYSNVLGQRLKLATDA